MSVTDKLLITRGLAAACTLHHVTNLNLTPPPKKTQCHFLLKCCSHSLLTPQELSTNRITRKVTGR